MKDQGLSREDGEYLVRTGGRPATPGDWTRAVADQQKTVDLLAKETGQEPFDAEILFDRRYEKVGAAAIAGTGAETGAGS